MPRTHRHGPDLPPCTCGIPNAPQSTQRHPESDPAESMRNTLTQCQYCWKSKSESVVLKKCAACQMEIYCVSISHQPRILAREPRLTYHLNLHGCDLVIQSPECQKKAWPSHKTKCKLNRTSRENPELASALDKLRLFTSKHRPTIAEYGIRALDLVVDPTRCLRDVLLLTVAYRAEARRPELSFYLVSADVVPLDMFGDRAEEMRGQLRLANQAQQRVGLTGSFFTVLSCASPGCMAMNITPVGFAKRDLVDFRPGMPWKEEMERRLNEGIVI